MSNKENKIISSTEIRNICKDALHGLLKNGASKADVTFSISTGTDYNIQDGKLENLERSEIVEIGLRAMIGQKQSFLSISDYSSKSIDQATERCVNMAKHALDDPYCDIYSDSKVGNVKLGVEEENNDILELAIECEKIAKDDKRIFRSDGVSTGHNYDNFFLMNSDGFENFYEYSNHFFSVTIFAKDDNSMENGYASSVKNRFSDLLTIEELAKRAKEKAIKKLGAKKIAPCNLDVIFSRDISASLISHLVSAIKGENIARNVSFLKDKMNQLILPKDISLIDDPLLDYHAGSYPFDGEGLCARKLQLIEDGVLKNWYLNIANANKLGLSPNGHSSRYAGGPPGETIGNIILNNGNISFNELAHKFKNFVVVDEIFSPQINPNNGDYSVGFFGFLYENGEISHPISECTISGNLLEMYASLVACDDLEIKGRICSPSLYVGKLSIG